MRQQIMKNPLAITIAIVAFAVLMGIALGEGEFGKSIADAINARSK